MNKGFTLIELMITVSLIGILSAVSYPSFKKFQAISRSSEAKIELASAYTAEQYFFHDFKVYHTCLRYMGYDPSRRLNQMYYAIGFREYPTLPNAKRAESLSLGLDESSCPNTAPPPPVGSNLIRFIGEKSIGAIAMTDAIYRLNAQPVSASLCNRTNISANDYIHCIGDSSSREFEAFVLPAVGIIDSENVAPNEVSVWTVNQDKEFKNIRPGY